MDRSSVVLFAIPDDKSTIESKAGEGLSAPCVLQHDASTMHGFLKCEALTTEFTSAPFVSRTVSLIQTVSDITQ
jgi:hypothetical protein